MKNYLSLLALSSAAVFVSPANASTVVNGSCVSVSASAGCLFKGNINSNGNGNSNSYVSAQDAYNLYNNTHPSANPDIFLNVIAASDDANFGSFGSITGAGTASGTWSLGSYLVNFVAVKSSNQFVLYRLGAPSSSGSWNTFNIPFGNNPHDLSHLVFFGSAAVSSVPEPGTWAMMLLGFAGIGLAFRRRRPAVNLKAV